LGAETPAAGGHWGSEGEIPNRRRQLRESGAEPPALGDFCNFSIKITHSMPPPLFKKRSRTTGYFLFCYFFGHFFVSPSPENFSADAFVYG